MSKLHIAEDMEKHLWLEGTLTAMRNATLKTAMEPCPYCNHYITFPLIARDSDIRRVKCLLDTASKIMTQYGITGNLLAEIRATAVLEIARREKKDHDKT